MSWDALVKKTFRKKEEILPMQMAEVELFLRVSWKVEMLVKRAMIASIERLASVTMVMWFPPCLRASLGHKLPVTLRRCVFQNVGRHRIVYYSLQPPEADEAADRAVTGGCLEGRAGRLLLSHAILPQ